MRKYLAVFVAIGSLTLPTARAAQGACDDFPLRTLRVEMKVRKEVYRRGDLAEVSLAVSRQTTAEPIRGARTAVVFQFKGNKMLHGVGRTDRQGRSLISIKLRKSDVSVGQVDMYGYAYLGTVDTYCAGVNEDGYRSRRRAFAVAP